MTPAGFKNASVAVNATSIVPSSGLTETSSQPSVAAAAGSGTLPSTASQKGPSRSTANILPAATDSPAVVRTEPNELADPAAEADVAADAAGGVDVRVILDQHFESSANAAAYHDLTGRGVHVR